MQTAKQLNKLLNREFDKVVFDQTQEELLYRQAIFALVMSDNIPSSIRTDVLGYLEENIPFSQVQGKIKNCCTVWLDGFKCEAALKEISAVYQLSLLFSKVPFKGDEEKCTFNALTTFFEGEHECRVTNQRFAKVFNTPGKWLDLSHFSEKERELVHRVRAEAHRVIGDLYDEDIASIVANACKYGPGQTTEQRLMRSSGFGDTLCRKAKERCSPPHKMIRPFNVTRSALPYVKTALRSNHSWLKGLIANSSGPTHQYWWDSTLLSMQILWNPEPLVEHVMSDLVRVNNANAVSVVPKNADTSRIICLENSFNGALQKSAGEDVKRKLHKSGINLYDQSINQKLALQGSIDDSVATIDLKNASGTLARSVPKLILPVEWYIFLASLRSAEGEINFPDLGYDNYIVRYEQFSSMGNGVTFELESLIFTAIVRAVVATGSQKQHLVSVYGDDIICPREDAEGVIEALRFFGFTTNKDKTFISGPFRESCGVDAYRGENIRPVVLKRRCTRVVDLWFYLNRIAYHCLDKQNLLLWSVYSEWFYSLNDLGHERREDPCAYIVPGPLTFSLKEDQHRVGKLELDTDDLESGVKMPLSMALDYDTRVKMCRSGKIKYFRLRLTQQYDTWVFADAHTKRILSENPDGVSTVSINSVDVAVRRDFTSSTCSNTLQTLFGMLGYKKGQLPLRGRFTRKFKETISLGWESYPAAVVRRYFPLD